MVSLTQGRHKAIIFTGPSGGGKTTLSQYTLKEFDKIERSVSVTTRAPRVGETDGVDYQFLTVEEFQQQIKEDNFVEWEQVYEGLYYGTLKSEVKRIWDAGKVVLFVVDVIGAESLKKFFGENSLKIFVKAPTMEVLSERLYSRGTENEESVAKRLKKAHKELEYEDFADTVIVNDVLKISKRDIHRLIQSYINI